MVINGEADVAALNVHIASHLAGRLYSDEFILAVRSYEEINLAFAVAKRDPLGILEAFDDALADVIALESSLVN